MCGCTRFTPCRCLWKASQVNMFEDKYLLSSFLAFIPTCVTGLKCFRLHFRDFQKHDLTREICGIKELVQVHDM